MAWIDSSDLFVSAFSDILFRMQDSGSITWQTQLTDINTVHEL